MKKIVLLIITASFGITVSAQNYQWHTVSGGSSFDEAKAVYADENGDVYTTGYFRGTVDFDPSSTGVFNLISAGGQDVFVQKIDANGNFVWAKRMGGTGDDIGNDIVRAGNEIVVTGSFENVADFSSTISLASAGMKDIFVMRIFTANGGLQFANRFGGIKDDKGTGIAATSSFGSFLYITGTFKDRVLFDPVFHGVINSNDDHVFVMRLQPLGTDISTGPSWVRSLKLNGPLSSIPKIALGASNSIFFTGNFRGTTSFPADLDPTSGTFNLTSYTSQGSVFVEKLNMAGAFIWAKRMGAQGLSDSRGITVDNSDNILVTGYYKGNNPTFGTIILPNPTSFVVRNGFVQKIDNNGTVLWAKSIESSGNVDANSVSVNNINDVYITGSYEGMTDFDPSAAVVSATSNGLTDTYIEKLTTNGDFIWVKNIGAGSADVGNDISVNNSGNIHTTGSFSGTVDFNTESGTASSTSNGLPDIFTQKIECTPTTSVDIQTHCSSYTWVDGITYTTNNNTAKDTILGAGSNGCDSVITLNLTILNSNTGTDVVVVCDSLLWIDGNTYFTSNNTASYTLTGSNMCDSIVTLNLTIIELDTSVAVNNVTITSNDTGVTYQWIDCDNGNTIISGETNQSYTATVNGSYAVLLNNGNCSDTSACVTITGVGINENSIFNGISIYPNPNNGILNFDLGNIKDVNIKVLNIYGQDVYQKHNINTSQHQLEINQAAGIYFIEVSAEGQTQLYKIIKK